jgi:hypothetical protein
MKYISLFKHRSTNFNGKRRGRTVGHRLYLLAILTMILPSLLMGTTAQALTFKAIQDTNASKPWYDKTDTGACSANSSGGVIDPQITGNNVETSFKFFAQNGYTNQQAAGIIGNLMYESGDSKDIDPTKHAYNGDGGYGIAQFTPATDMRKWVSAQPGPAPNNDPDSLIGQLHYLFYVLSVGWRKQAGIAVLNSSTIAEAALAFETQYEHPKNPQSTIAQRIANANKAYNLYSGDTTSAAGDAGGGGCIIGASTSPDCTPADGVTVTGNKRILCAAQKYQGIYYTMDGGPHSNGAYTAFRKRCPIDSIPTAVKNSTANNPGPCTTDCSGLVSAAVDEVFGQNLGWVVHTLEEDTSNWKHLDSIASAQPGDVVVIHADHVEIVDHVDAAANVVYTFGSHHTGSQTGPSKAKFSYYAAGAFRYIGPGTVVGD